jgi:hypothetical protein
MNGKETNDPKLKLIKKHNEMNKHKDSIIGRNQSCQNR